MCDILEYVSDPKIEEGLEIGILNARGFTYGSGGASDREIAGHFNSFTTNLGIAYPRTQALLKRIAAYYLQDGARNDREEEWMQLE